MDVALVNWIIKSDDSTIRDELPVANIRLQIDKSVIRWIKPFLPIGNLVKVLFLYIRYLSEWYRYSSLKNSEKISIFDTLPCLFDRTAVTRIDPHYFYQDIWAFKAIKDSSTIHHVDIGSRAIFVGMLTAITNVAFIDIRPMPVYLDNLICKRGNILHLPFDNDSISSLSCLHVAEHIGLGRYGDQLDPDGTKKAARELARVLAPNGNLYFSVPVGKQRVCFNAHRIHSPNVILSYFNDLILIQFYGIDDHGRFLENIDPNELSNSNYACGLFHFTKKRSEKNRDIKQY